jgi:rhamnulokinase
VLPAVAPPGTRLGPLAPRVAADCGLDAAEAIATTSHDTASAVAAVPAQGAAWAYISLGTWSLVGVELDAPLRTAAALAANFTNEGGLAGTTRFLKNVPGLWLVQECQRTWAARVPDASFPELTAAAAAAPLGVCLVDPDDPSFVEPGDMPARIQRACASSGQPTPQTRGQIIRCVLDSLAVRHRVAIQELTRLTGRPIDVVHLVGGGVQNELLCQLTADATQRAVIAGPVEAAAIGNALVQALALGDVSSPAEIRAIVARSFPRMRYEPRSAAIWDELQERLLAMARQRGP